MARASIADPDTAPPVQRLRDALAQLVANGSAEPLTAKALCELAGVSRNALYRYHPDILHELRKLQHRRRRDPAPAACELKRLREDNARLHQQAGQLAALVDHYFAAWQDARTLLQRRERELAELRRNVKPKVITLRK
jgi:hypothetical protein